MSRIIPEASVYRGLAAQRIVGGLLPAVLLCLLSASAAAAADTGASPHAVQTLPGMPPVVDSNNLYSETRADKLNPIVARHLARVYVPNRKSNNVAVIDPATFEVIDRYPVGRNPQHVVPSWDL